MLRNLFCALFACSAFLAAEPVRDPSVSGPTAIFMEFEGKASSRALDEMKREISSLLKPAKIQLAWRLLDAPRTDEFFSDLVVVKFRGRCHMEGVQALFSELGPYLGPYEENQSLGSTRVSDGHVLPFSQIECDRIRRSIAPMAVAWNPEQRDALMGRAIGRVLAHELFHILTKTVHHGDEGVAKTSYSRYDLVADGFSFSFRDSEAIRARSMVPAKRSSRPAGPVSDQSFLFVP